METTLESELERVVAVDWSGDKGPGQRKKIWAGVWTATASGGGKVTLEGGRSRAELIEWLIALGRKTPRMVVGIDCCFSYPAWFLREHGCGDVFDFWRQVAEGKGEAWLHKECAEARFWGAKGTQRTGKRPAEFCGDGLHTSMRRTDLENKILPLLEGGDEERAAKMRGITAKSPFQIGGSGSVGTGSLRAMPWLLRLREAGFRVWPFEEARLVASYGDGVRPLVVEMYTRLLTGPVAKSNAEARKAYLDAKKERDARYAGLSRRVMEKALGSEDAFDALVCTMEMAKRRGEFAGLRATEDEVLRLEGMTWRPGVF